MKKGLQNSVDISKERPIRDIQLEQGTAQNRVNVIQEETNRSIEEKRENLNLPGKQNMYFRMSLFSIDPARKDAFIQQSDMLKNKVKERLGGGILSAYMVEVERDKILLVGIYDSVANAVKGKLVADEIFLEMDSKFIEAPLRIEEGPVVYSVNY